MPFPFSYVDLKFPFAVPRAKNYIFPQIRALTTKQHAYMQVAQLQPTYIVFFAQN
jgi:hypothetical protein